MAKINKNKGLLKNTRIRVNNFGAIETNLNIDAINAFLNRNLEDKKFKGREDLSEIKGEDANLRTDSTGIK